jgi:hypothetical protein
MPDQRRPHKSRVPEYGYGLSAFDEDFHLPRTQRKDARGSVAVKRYHDLIGSFWQTKFGSSILVDDVHPGARVEHRSAKGPALVMCSLGRSGGRRSGANLADTR